jgi:hypothetical protein
MKIDIYNKLNSERKTTLKNLQHVKKNKGLQ